MSESVSELLEHLGLGQYNSNFADNHIGQQLLPELTNEDLKDISVHSLGHRKAILQAINALIYLLKAQRAENRKIELASVGGVSIARKFKIAVLALHAPYSAISNPFYINNPILTYLKIWWAR